MRWALAVSFVVGVIGVLASVADAKPRIAIIPVEGDESEEMLDAIADAIDGSEVDLVSTGKIIKAIDKLGYEGELTEKQAKKLAKEIEADAVVHAKLGKKDPNKTLKFTLFVGGKKVRGFKVYFNNEKSPNFKSKLRDKMLEKVGDAKASKDDEDEDEDDEKKKKKKTEDDDEEDEDDRKKKKRLAARDGDDDEDPEVDAAVRRVSHTANRVAIRLDIGASFANRTLTFTQRSEFPEGPQPYRHPYHPGVRIEGEVYPLAFTNPKSFLSGLGLAGAYDRTISLTLSTSNEPGVRIPTKHYRWSVGARFRIAFGTSPTAPTATLGVDYGKRVFSPDRSSLMVASSLDLPSTAYTSIDPGLALRFPLGTAVAVIASGKGLLVLDTGSIQDLDQYGRAKVFGVEAHGGVDIVLGNRFGIRLVGEFRQIGFSFVGNGAMTTDRDMDPETKDVGGASDRSVGVALTLAVLY